MTHGPQRVFAQESGSNFAIRLWRNSRFLRVFVRNLVLTVLLEFVFLPFFGPLLGVSHLERSALDLMMRFFSNTDRIQYREIPAAFTLINIDDATMKSWGDPPLLPRATLLELIRSAARNGARAIVVDANFSRSYSAFGPEFSKADRDLQAFLAGYGSDKSAPPIIFVRPSAFEENERNAACPPLQRSFLNEAAFTGNTQWSSVRFDSDSDYVLRRWRLFERICADGRPRVIPSVQLAVIANVATNRPAENGVPALERWLLQFRPETCTECPNEPTGLLGWRRKLNKLANGKEEVEPLRLGKIEIDPEESELEQRIVFRLPYIGSSDRRAYASVKVATQETTTPVLDDLPADKFLSALEKDPDTDRIRGRIVFIGATFHDSGDWFATPLGRMPGVLVLINATYSLMEYGQLREKSLSREILDLFVIVTILTAIFVFTRGVWVLLLSTILVMAYLLPNSFALFEQGLWLNFVIPLVGIVLHHMVESVTERFELRHKATGHQGESK